MGLINLALNHLVKASLRLAFLLPHLTRHPLYLTRFKHIKLDTHIKLEKLDTHIYSFNILTRHPI